jgi:protein-tyrosine kinase
MGDMSKLNGGTGPMSKIYKALEKAERDRESKKGVSFRPETEGEEKVENYGLKPDLPKGEMISDLSLVTFFQPGSLAAEQFRKLRTHLLRMKISEHPGTIMVTSATSNEGKTFVATNLAIGIARHFHTHALLIDCDMRNPKLAKWFGLQNGKGLSDYLIEDRKVSDLLLKTEIEKLSIIPGGSIPDNPTELIGSKKMEALVHELKSRYKDRFIILDATPLLATSEPEVLAKLVDGIIIVIRAGMTPRETVKQAIAPLEKEKIIGFVLNHVEFKSSGLSSRYFGSDGYYYRYGYGYGYGKKGTKVQSRWGKLFPFTKNRS